MQNHAVLYPEPGHTLKNQKKIKAELNVKFLIKTKSNLAIFIPITFVFILFMANYLSFGCVFSIFLTLFLRPPGSETLVMGQSNYLYV
jgi:hypothetical protein